ncbi:N-acetyl-gamma-glutamyl-phosphate reductase [Alicyclobacillus cellulosilyticus]|uniref:N-acetyl-gamma-glutamyl-phosphate reductase n=1 Tax=Alicyclobacillus cellulosilyticus TaxID=1003997 RepID=A0A917K945_9BACL|nr:N-acetyl-gamma-glutamyl-phosphate reductase [Alicyclobacillus cellulosilyticus]GGJ03198.1 N-acetyl-gamma-glutamyl-phosphate reductase [Alicyclobacillus cellulosilyticus]
MADTKVRVGVVGASGYAGMELLRLLAHHPGVELTYVAGNHDESNPLPETFPFLHGWDELRIEAFDAELCARRCDAVFVALPSGVSGGIAVQLWRMGKRVIDLSGDLRLPPDQYEAWYQKPAVDAEALAAAVYGLTEWNRPLVRSAQLVANPGCYATAVLLALLPAVVAGWMADGQPVVVDAKSGVSGAGRHPKLPYQFGELADNFYAYRVGRHQHTPEIEQQLARTGGGQRVLLTTHLIPAVRGIYATCYIPLARPVPLAEAFEHYRSVYAGEPFMHVHPPGQVPEMKHVRASNRCHLGLAADGRSQVLIVMSVIDNLQKGAAGQALQNFNLMHGFPETTALHAWPVYP